MRLSVLVLEPDVDVRSSMADVLHSEGFEVLEEGDVDQGAARAMQLRSGIILMAEDLLSSGHDELLTLIRRRTNSPIIVLGAGGETATVAALLQGADMYLKKAVDPKELVSRVRALSRRIEADSHRGSSESEKLSLAEVLPPNVLSSLTETEMRLFACLLEKCGRVVRHEELMMKTWGGPKKEGRLRFYIHELRRKLEKVIPYTLHTRSGVGYLLLPSEVDCLEGVSE